MSAAVACSHGPRATGRRRRRHAPIQGEALAHDPPAAHARNSRQRQAERTGDDCQGRLVSIECLWDPSSQTKQGTTHPKRKHGMRTCSHRILAECGVVAAVSPQRAARPRPAAIVCCHHPPMRHNTICASPPGARTPRCHGRTMHLLFPTWQRQATCVCVCFFLPPPKPLPLYFTTCGLTFTPELRHPTTPSSPSHCCVNTGLLCRPPRCDG